MLVSPILDGMSDHDLRQRYKNTYVLYGGQVMYVREFDLPYIYLTKATGEEISTKFNWKALDISRPRSRWYFYKADRNTRYCAYVSFPPRKQYHRGLCAENMQIMFPDRAFTGFGLYSALLTQGFEPFDVERIKLGGEGLFKDHLLVKSSRSEENRFDVYFRTAHIASIFENKRCALYFPRFKQELEEAIDGFGDVEIVLLPPIHPMLRSFAEPRFEAPPRRAAAVNPLRRENNENKYRAFVQQFNERYFLYTCVLRDISQLENGR